MSVQIFHISANICYELFQYVYNIFYVSMILKSNMLTYNNILFNNLSTV